MRNLPAEFAVQGMQPQVVLVFRPADRVHHGIPVGSESRRSKVADYGLRIQFEYLKRGVGRAGLQNPEDIPVLTPARRGKGCRCDKEGVVPRKIRERKWWPTGDARLRQAFRASSG